jgi:hypothetical protein
MVMMPENALERKRYAGGPDIRWRFAITGLSQVRRHELSGSN